LAHATWGAQNSGCAGDMGMTTVPFGQGATGSYTATVTTPGGATTAYPSLAADQDAWFRSDDITNNNGTAITLHLRRESGNLEYAVVRFDLSSLSAGAQINSATARFYVKATKGHPQGPVSVHRVTADWTETGATWETMGDKFDSTLLNTIPAQPAAGGVWVEVNLTAQVQAWVNGGQPNYGIMLIPSGEGTHAEYISREGSVGEQPRLEVIVGTGPASPMTITATGTLSGNPSPASDITRTRTRTDLPAFQPPGNVALQLGTDPGEDTLLDSFYDIRNYGGASYLQVHDNGSDWQQYPLIRFDLARLPRGAAVRSARLELRLLNVNGPGKATIHQVTRSWVEGSKSGGGIADGATWLTRDGTSPWTSAGGDINTPVVAETAINGGETWVSWEIAPLVERWLTGEPNHGLLIKPDSALDQAKFSSREDSNVGVAPKLTITYACECGSPCLAPQGSGTVMMVVINPTTLVPADAYKKVLFESWGYTVNIIGENSNAAAYATAAASNDVFYISETVNSSQVGTRIKDVPIGVVSEDGNYNADLGFATGSGHTVGSTLNVTDTSHYITALFPTGQLDIYDAAMEQLTVSGTAAPGLQPLADSGGASSLVVLDKGADMAGGGTAAGSRVMLPLGRVGKFNWDYLNGNGRLLVQRALQWGTGNIGEPPKNLLLVVVNPGSLTTQEAAKKTLIESWGYTVSLIDEADSQANYNAALAANDVVYITEDVASGTLGTKLVNATIGVVTEEDNLSDEFGLSDSIHWGSGTVLKIEGTHYITETLPPGNLTILTASESLADLTGSLAPALQIHGVSTAGPALVSVEAGADVIAGRTAAGRRVQLPWGGDNFDVNHLNADGLTLMKRAIEWGAGAGTGGPTGPVAHWKLDDGTGTTAVDSVGGHDGTLLNGPAWVGGQIGDALHFDGSNDRVDAGTFDVNGSGLTLMGWFNADALPATTDPRIISKASSTAEADAWWQLSILTTGTTRNIRLRTKAGGTTSTLIDSSTNLGAGAWYFAVGTYDAATGEMKLYLNGIEVASQSHPVGGAIDTNAAVPVAIGANGSAEEFFDGTLDDVRVYDRALSVSEIATLYTAGGGGGGGGSPTIVEVRVATGNDDAEERVSSGNIDLTSSDLELISDGGNAQLVGMRFTGVAVPNGATISNAWIQFKVDETNTGATNVNIQGETSDSALQFTTTNSNISSRGRTTASIPWAPVSWTTVGEAGPDQRTPDISAVIQEIVNRPGWASGNDMVMIITGSGERTAESYNGDAAGAPLLHIEY
ncbi:MAG: DNRLRE domain-containing protein, partial [Gammaproteobacteria bacterium]